MFENKEIECPACGSWNPREKWFNVEMDCEICGYHNGIQCPVCRESYDLIQMEDKLKTRNLEPKPPPKKLYRIWNITKQTYDRPNNRKGTNFYNNLTGAKLGLRRIKELWWREPCEFEIHEYEATYVRKITG